MSADSKRAYKFRKLLFLALLIVILALVAHSIYDAEKPWVIPEEVKRLRNPVPPSDSALREARQVYSEQCANCHGEHGKGDGPEAWMHRQKPSDLTDDRHMRTLTDGAIFYQITEGRRPMPSFKRRLTENQRWELVNLIRTLAQPASAPSDRSEPSPPNATQPKK